MDWFLTEASDEEAVDTIELAFIVTGRHHNEVYQSEVGATSTFRQGVNDLNVRFLEHGLGYQFEHGRLIPFNEKKSTTMQPSQP